MGDTEDCVARVKLAQAGDVLDSLRHGLQARIPRTYRKKCVGVKQVMRSFDGVQCCDVVEFVRLHESNGKCHQPRQFERQAEENCGNFLCVRLRFLTNEKWSRRGEEKDYRHPKQQTGGPTPCSTLGSGSRHQQEPEGQQGDAMRQPIAIQKPREKAASTPRQGLDGLGRGNKERAHNCMWQVVEQLRSIRLHNEGPAALQSTNVSFFSNAVMIDDSADQSCVSTDCGLTGARLK